MSQILFANKHNHLCTSVKSVDKKFEKKIEQKITTQKGCAILFLLCIRNQRGKDDPPKMFNKKTVTHEI